MKLNQSNQIKTRKIRRLKRLYVKILKRKYFTIFKRICLNNDSLSHTLYIYIYIWSWQNILFSLLIRMGKNVRAAAFDQIHLVTPFPLEEILNSVNSNFLLPLKILITYIYIRALVPVVENAKPSSHVPTKSTKLFFSLQIFPNSPNGIKWRWFNCKRKSSC